MPNDNNYYNNFVFFFLISFSLAAIVAVFTDPVRRVRWFGFYPFLNEISRNKIH